MATAAANASQLTGLVGEAMVKAETVQAVRPHTSVAEAATLLAEHGLRRAIVLDEDDRVLGVISQRDLLRFYVKHLSSASGNFSSHETSVGSLLTREEPITVQENLPLAKAALVLATNKIGCLPVVDAQRRLVGLLSISDLLQRVTSCHGDMLEHGFQFYSPLVEAKPKIPAYVRRTSGDLVIPLNSIDDSEGLTEMAQLGYDPATGRILVKFQTPGAKGTDGAMRVKRDKENVVISAAGFVARFQLTGKPCAFDVSSESSGRYLILTPR